MNNFQKVIIGSSSIIKENREIHRFHRIIYNPIWSKDIYGLRSTFKKFCEIRNYLMGHPNEFAIDSIEKGFGPRQEYLNFLLAVVTCLFIEINF